jgi:TnpA family transposase
MALRELLSSSQGAALEAIPIDRAGLIEHYALSDQDLSLIRRRRGAQNRLGLAVQLALLQYPGRALLPNETPPAELLAFLARQLGLSASAWARYAERDEAFQSSGKAINEKVRLYARIGQVLLARRLGPALAAVQNG